LRSCRHNTAALKATEIPLTGLLRQPYQAGDGAPHGDQKGTRSGHSASIRGCPRNCSRQADGQDTTGKPGRWPKAKTREPGNLPSNAASEPSRGAQRGSRQRFSSGRWPDEGAPSETASIRIGHLVDPRRRREAMAASRRLAVLAIMMVIAEPAWAHHV